MQPILCIMEKAKAFFENYLGHTAEGFRLLQQSGSARKNYLAEAGGQKYIITHNPHLRENEAFLYFSQKFKQLGLNTPQIFAVNEDKTLYIQEFLGEKTLSDIIAEEGHSARVKELVKQILEKLYFVQQNTQNEIDFSQSYEYECYDELPITHDLYYFKNFLVDVLEIPYHKGKLLKEFRTLVQEIERLKPQCIMLRDFQARNILVDDKDNVHFIDYQSAMQGPAVYDVVSFLYQAKAHFPKQWKEEMTEKYISLWQEHQREALRQAVPYAKLIRFLQVLGAYGFRGILQKKPHFLNSLEKGIENIQLFFSEWDKVEDFPELKDIIQRLSPPKID